MVFETTSLKDALPADFDLDRHDNIQIFVKTKKDMFPPSWEQFRPAWRAVPLRLLWATEHHVTFTESINRAGSAPPWPDRYIQDRESFAFFVSGHLNSPLMSVLLTNGQCDLNSQVTKTYCKPCQRKRLDRILESRW